MGRDKQIEEMAAFFSEFCEDVLGAHFNKAIALEFADRFCDAGYRKQSEGEWISVEERLPEKEGKYLICTDRGYVTFGFFGNYDGNGNLTILRNNPRFDYRNVIYWMPLPEPPKGE